MIITLSEEIIQLFDDASSIKALATTDEDGTPHVVYKDSLLVNDKGQILCLEFLEPSHTNQNLVRSIWFGRKVSINILSNDKRSYQIKGKVIKAIITGATFEKYYKQVLRQYGDADLSTVWVIEPEKVIDQTFHVKKNAAESEHPLLLHLDRIAIK